MLFSSPILDFLVGLFLDLVRRKYMSPMYLALKDDKMDNAQSFSCVTSNFMFGLA